MSDMHQTGIDIYTGLCATWKKRHQLVDYPHTTPTLPLPHPHSTDLASCSFFMFPPVKRQMKGKQSYGIKHARDSFEGAISDVFFCQRGLAPWLRGLKG